MATAALYHHRLYAAHSITLGAAGLGHISLPQASVEAVIALSIVFAAAEILAKQDDHRSLAIRSPWLVVFAFGLLHGLGFTGALADIGLPQTSAPLALLAFNLGVETGQLLFVALSGSLFLGLRRAMRPIQQWRSAGQPLVNEGWDQTAVWVTRPLAYTIGGVACW